MTGAGEVLVADLGPKLWKGDVTLDKMRHEDAAEIQALIEALDGSINTFNLYDPRKKYPRADPRGVLLGSATPVISAVLSSNKEFSISGLPAGYVLSAGDFSAFNYGSNPLRRAFHRIVNTVVANASGVASSIEVRPHFRPGIVTGLQVTLIKPSARVKIVPESFNSGIGRGAMTDGMAFQVIQVP